MDASGERGAVRVESRLRANNGDAPAAAATEGFGVVCLPAFILDEAILAGALEPVLLDHDWGHEELHLVWPDTRHLPQRVRRLIDHLAEALAGEPPWNACLGRAGAAARRPAGRRRDETADEGD